ncbi:MAG: hypothetical protein R6X02_26970 [Enhygromyxa sp.]
MTTDTIVHKIIIGSLVAIGLSLGPTFTAAAENDDDDDDLQTLDAKASARAGEWWQWSLAFAVDENPILDPDGRFCELGQDHEVWYLAGTFGGSVTRSCTVPADAPLFFPLLNWIYLASPGEKINHRQMLDALDPGVEQTCALHLLVDGQPIVDDLFSLRLTTKQGFDVELPANNLAGRDPGVYGPAAADGFYALLEPLEPGEHLVEFGGAVCDEQGAILFESSATYMLTVE